MIKHPFPHASPAGLCGYLSRVSREKENVMSQRSPLWTRVALHLANTTPEAPV